MKILMLTPYLPYPPASGGQIRTYNLLKYLSAEHEVTLVSLYKKEQEKQNASYLSKYCKALHLCKRAEKPWQLSNIVKAVFGHLPFLIVRNYSKEAKKVVKELLEKEKFDVIHAETFYVMPHIPQTQVPVLLVEQTLEYNVYRHYISSKPFFIHHPLRLDIFKLKLWETHYWKKASLVAAVSEADATAITALEPSIKPVVIPNGAGDEMFDETQNHHTNTVSKILFMGNFSWMQNVEAAEFLIYKVLPILKNKISNFKIVIAGQNIPESFHMMVNSQVSVVDIEPSDNAKVSELYKNSSIFVAPIYGPGGTRLKILAAMASKLPVITTRTGAEGLELEDGRSVLLAQTAHEFAAQTEKLCKSPSLQEQIASEAFANAKQNFSWESITGELVKSYKKIIKSYNKKTEAQT